MKSLYLVDASNMFFRAFFAIPPLTNDKGMPTNALYGFLAMTNKLMKDVRPDYICYCFDLKEPSFRLEMYPQYKANRDEMPEDLVPQIPYLKKMTELLGVRHIEKVGFEADDVIGTLALQGLAHQLNVVIVSGDKDFAQLVRPGISLYDTMKDVRTDSEGVKAKFGVRPDQIIDYLAMVGDASDNVPGVRGIGPKGAQKLLNDFETLDGVYKNIDKIKGATQTKLIEGKENAFLSRKLCTIVTDVTLDGVVVEDLKFKEIEREPLRELVRELGFKSFERTLFEGGPAPETKAKFSGAGKFAKKPAASPETTGTESDSQAGKIEAVARAAKKPRKSANVN